MSGRAVQRSELAEAMIPYAPSRRKRSPTEATDPVETAGQTILGLLNQAADAQKLSRQLQAAEDRIAELESDLRNYTERAERAEKWLNYISSEIQQKFFGNG